MSQDPEITLTLPRSQVNFILAALGELPLKASYGVFENVRSQAAQQSAVAAAEAAAAAMPPSAEEAPT